MKALMQSFSEGMATFFSYIPQLIGALVILIIGYIIAKVLQAITTRVLKSMGFESWMESGGIKQFFERSQTQQTPLSVIGKLVFWLLFFIALTMAVDTLGISQISAVLAQFIAYIPQIIAAILILILAAMLANFVAGIVRGATGNEIIGSIAQYGIIVFATFAALTQLGIAPELIAPTFLILLGAIAGAVALAFGFGGQETAAKLIEQWYTKGKEAASKMPAAGGAAKNVTQSREQHGSQTRNQLR
jgi:small-conductance mechanosensitive channel